MTPRRLVTTVLVLGLMGASVAVGHAALTVAASQRTQPTHDLGTGVLRGRATLISRSTLRVSASFTVHAHRATRAYFVAYPCRRATTSLKCQDRGLRIEHFELHRGHNAIVRTTTVTGVGKQPRSCAMLDVWQDLGTRVIPLSPAPRDPRVGRGLALCPRPT